MSTRVACERETARGQEYARARARAVRAHARQLACIYVSARTCSFGCARVRACIFVRFRAVARPSPALLAGRLR
eukprot:3087848-Pleurochrysis_carterae.AAC.2